MKKSKKVFPVLAFLIVPALMLGGLILSLPTQCSALQPIMIILPKIVKFTVDPSTTYPNAYTYTANWQLVGATLGTLKIDCKEGLSIKDPKTNRIFKCGDTGNPLLGYKIAQDLQFTNSTNKSISVNLTLSVRGVSSLLKTITIPANSGAGNQTADNSVDNSNQTTQDQTVDNSGQTVEQQIQALMEQIITLLEQLIQQINQQN